ncbi:hypothetical protein [Microvirga makkahensis]|uniref:Uncharacterized protein n=1 Tax=Microvirga makkahensis TaxID=1128670 RepID=A0A7X3MVT4_9HYPH|nr:hypothetical protein [Microvirga makkahensis]MXQ13978.1 hypothetical protein [Microvirga makkahensis]
MKHALVLSALLLAAPAQAQTILNPDDMAGWDYPEQVAATLPPVRNALDPKAAQFRYIRRGKPTPGRRSWCGEVNLKNRYGGYVGFRPYVVVVDVTRPKGKEETVWLADGSADEDALVRGVQKANGC